MSSPERRMEVLRRQLLAAPAAGPFPPPPASRTASPRTSTGDDVVIVSALRTPVCKARRGALAGCTPDHLLATVLRETLTRTGLDPTIINDIVVGNVLSPGGGAVMARVAQLLAGIPHTVPLTSVNRQCSSGLQAVASVAAAIKSGLYEVGIAAGVESMSQDPMGDVMPSINLETAAASPAARDALVTMGITSENVAERFGITREAQDAFAAVSHAKAAFAQSQGHFTGEIVAVECPGNNGKAPTMVSADDGIRPQTTPEALAGLKAAFKEGGSTTAGNSSQTSDGAAAVLMMKRSTAARLGLPVLAAFRSFTVVGVPPAIMGIGPAFAVPGTEKGSTPSFPS